MYDLYVFSLFSSTNDKQLYLQDPLQRGGHVAPLCFYNSTECESTLGFMILS